MSNAATMCPETLLETALTHVESHSVRRWATTEHNRAIFISIAESAIEKARREQREPNVHTFAALILVSAIGL